MDERLQQLQTDLGRVRENLRRISDDIWLLIDHTDNDSLLQGSEFLRTFNVQRDRFSQVADETSALIQRFKEQQGLLSSMPDDTNQGITTSTGISSEHFARSTHSLSEDFTYTTPTGYVLLGRRHSCAHSWRSLYLSLFRILAQMHPERAAILPDSRENVSPRGNLMFSRDEAQLRAPLSLGNGIYAEGNLSANGIRFNIRQLLRVFGIDEAEMRIFLSESNTGIPTRTPKRNTLKRRSRI